eukprot:6609134-Lingulodinium_polyedra.AAC.1
MRRHGSGSGASPPLASHGPSAPPGPAWRAARNGRRTATRPRAGGGGAQAAPGPGACAQARQRGPGAQT